MKKMKISSAHIAISACLIAAGVLLCFLFGNIVTKSKTVFEFTPGGAGNNGFKREATVYTEDDTTYVKFSGKITADGTAEIALLSEDGNTVIYSETYTAISSRKIDIEITGLTPQTYYILRFSSNDAKTGHLLLTTEQALTERPERPEKPERTVSEQSSK